MNEMNDFYIAESILSLEPNALFKVHGIEEEDVVWFNEDDITKPAWSDIQDKARELLDEVVDNQYQTDRAKEYPSTKEFMEAYTEKEILGDDTKWQEYIVKYNQVRSDNPKPSIGETP